MNLISIIDDSEKEFESKFVNNGLVHGVNGAIEYEKIKSHNRATILKLVEGIEKWAEDNNKEVWGFGGGYDNVIIKNNLLSLLQSLKDKLKDKLKQ